MNGVGKNKNKHTSNTSKNKNNDSAATATATTLICNHHHHHHHHHKYHNQCVPTVITLTIFLRPRCKWRQSRECWTGFVENSLIHCEVRHGIEWQGIPAPLNNKKKRRLSKDVIKKKVTPNKMDTVFFFGGEGLSRGM